MNCTKVGDETDGRKLKKGKRGKMFFKRRKIPIRRSGIGRYTKKSPPWGQPKEGSAKSAEVLKAITNGQRPAVQRQLTHCPTTYLGIIKPDCKHDESIAFAPLRRPSGFFVLRGDWH